MALTLRSAARSDVGLVRDGNEDAVYVGPRLLAVADGMGGHAAGEVASRTVIRALAPLDRPASSEDLRAAMRQTVAQANAELRELVTGNRRLEGMGTTLTAAVWTGDGLVLGHVGDSRAYLLRDGQLVQITHDHTYVQDLIDAGRITAAEAPTHPQRSLITRALDGRADVVPDVTLHDLRAGDRLLLCTDGLSGVVSDDTIREALATPDREAAVDLLVELALKGGGPDNVSCVVADVVDDDSAAAPVLVAGAAADSTGARTGSKYRPGGRAALISSWRRPGGAGDAGRKRPPRRLSRRVVVLGAIALFAIGLLGVTAAWMWVRSQYYLAVDPAGHVAIYRGVDGALGGLELSSLAERRDVTAAALPQFERERLRQGISARSLTQARQIAERLRDEQQTCPPPVPPRPAVRGEPAAPSPRPAPAPTLTCIPGNAP